MNDSSSTSTSPQTTTRAFCVSKKEGVAFAAALQSQGKDWQSITITKLGSSGDCFVFSVTSESSVLVPPTYLYELLPMLPTPLPDER